MLELKNRYFCIIFNIFKVSVYPLAISFFFDLKSDVFSFVGLSFMIKSVFLKEKSKNEVFRYINKPPLLMIFF